MLSGDYAIALGARLRAVRRKHGLSLQDVEEQSSGRLTAVMLGCYERGDRAVSARRLCDLADVYGIPISTLLPEAQQVRSRESATTVVLNIKRLSQMSAEQAGPLARYAATICSQRGVDSGRWLPIRGEDLKSLAIIYGISAKELTDRLISWRVVAPDARSALGETEPSPGDVRGG